ncbi:MAG: hypothetical protein HY578_09705 [Nitrospinae bacterium]|nr:hypothetical protein [Nitrospinota bacterium]
MFIRKIESILFSDSGKIKVYLHLHKFSRLLILFIVTFSAAHAFNSSADEKENEVPILPRYVIHFVSPGDNLHFLSAYYYGNARFWKKILNENLDVIKNPNTLEIGTKLKIPVESSWVPQYSIEEFRKMAEKGE